MKSKLEKSLEIIEKISNALKGHEEIISLEFNGLNEQELRRFAKQEKINFINADNNITYCFCIFKTDNVTAHLRAN